MATENTVKAPVTATPGSEKTSAGELMLGPLIQASLAQDGTITINEALNALKLVDVADVDLLLTFANGDHVVIANGALDALGSHPPDAVFNDQKISLPELFKLVGLANPAKSGSLRLVTENIDANPPPEEAVQQPETPPPAPMVKVNAGTSAGVGKGPGNGEGEGEVPATVVPYVTAQPAVYRVGKSTQSVQDLLDGTGLGQPNITSDLYTAPQFKVLPSGRTDLPLGAYDASASSEQLATRYSPAGQSTVETINGTGGNDSIDFNPGFSADAGQWSKDLHITINNFSDISSIQLVFNAAKIAMIPGFDLQGAGVTRDSPTSNSWHVTPDAAMLLNGLDVSIVYNVNDSAAPVDFGADVIINGHAGPFAFEVVNNLNLTWRDAVTLADFSVTSSTGAPLMVLPRAGVGVEVFAGGGDDQVSTGAGPDLIHGGSGDDTLNAGLGNDVLDGGLGADRLDGGQGIDNASYENATTGLTATLDTGLGLTNTGEAAGDTYVNIENLRGSIYDDILVGDAQANVLTGLVGDDKLIGRGNGDTLDGGAGNDTASYEYATSDVTVSLTSNTGTAGEADGDTLISIENLIGGAGNDTFTGAAGIQANTFDGLSGNDTVSYAPSSAGIVATLTTGLSGVVQTNDAAGDTFTHIERLTGSSYDDTLIGDSTSNILNGGAGTGSDTLEGLGGADSFIGGAGSDTASYEHSALSVTASLTTVFPVGPAVVQTNDALGDTFSGVENLTGTSLSDTLIGDSNANVLTGGDGDDVLEGMVGTDTLIGGSGDDTASYAHALSGIAASLTTGLSGFISAGDAAGDTFDGIENMTGSNYADTLTGDAGSNILDGGTGNDVLEGLAGADTLIGGLGANTASYEHSPDQGGGLGVIASLLTPASNTGDALGDTYSLIQNLTGSAFDDTLVGDTNNNILTGGAGNDTMSGGLGTDSLLGGDGNDVLTDDGIGAAQLSGGNGDDLLTLTGYDSTIDTMDGGVGTDTLIIDQASPSFWIFNMQASATQASGTIQNNWGSVWGNFNGIENITATGSNRLFVYVSNGDNIITGGSGGADLVDYRFAVAGVNVNLATGVVTGGSGNDTLAGIEVVSYGSHYNDNLIGTSVNNEFNGGLGADYIDGGAGIDKAWFDQYNSGSVTVSLMASSLNTALGIVFTDVAAGDTLINIEQLVGSNNYGDFLYGDGSANWLYGQNGNDVLEGMAGTDVIDGGGNVDTASYAHAGLAASGSATTAVGQGVTASLTTSFSVGPAVFNAGDAAGDTYVNVENLQGSSFDDVLIGNGSANALDGGAGNDVLEGLDGADVFTGGLGMDTVSYAHSTAGVTADLSGFITNTNDAFNDTYFGIENLTGTNYDDHLYGDSNDNVLDGGTGTNQLDGNGGNDTVSYANATGAVSIDLASGSVTGASRTDTLVSIERVIGSSFNDTITGSAGDDWIDAGVGQDTIDGAGGNDTLSYASATGGVTATINGANSQNDTISNFENIYGSVYGDMLTGDANNNVIEGGLGNDTLNGAIGTDTLSYANSVAAVSVNISSALVASVAANSATGGEGSDTLANFENITGSAYNDVLIGDGNANVIVGGDGNDMLIGGAGADTLSGGNGTDTVSYENAGADVTVTINGSGSVGDANGDVLTSIENLIGSAFGDVLTGDGSNNVIDGGAGNDTINAGAGTDTITYLTAASAVSVNLSSAGINATGGAGSDTLTNFENIIGSIFNDTLTGDGGANVMEGGLGNDILNGGTGTDTLSYENATAAVSVNITTTLIHGVAANTASGGAGSDTLSNFENITGSAYNDTLIGGTGANIIDGGAGDDFILGGVGADTLIGGAGTDTVSYENAGSAVQATLGGASLTHLGDALGDTFSGIENLTGSTFNDILYGDSNNNVLVGGAGNDDLRGYDGNDTLDGRLGNDTLRGGNGEDTFLIDVTAANLPSRVYGEGNTSAQLGGGDTVKLYGLVSGQSYSLTTLANVTDTSEILDIRDGVNISFSLTSADVRNFVDGGNGSNIWIKADAGDTISVNSVAGETIKSFSVNGGTDYVAFDASNTQVAAIHWQTT